MSYALLVGGAAGCLAGFVLGWGWRDRPDFLVNVRILELLTAVGTVAATIAAVGIAWHSHLQNAKIQKQAEKESSDGKALQIYRDWLVLEAAWGEIEEYSEIYIADPEDRPAFLLSDLERHVHRARALLDDPSRVRSFISAQQADIQGGRMIALFRALEASPTNVSPEVYEVGEAAERWRRDASSRRKEQFEELRWRGLLEFSN